MRTFDCPRCARVVLYSLYSPTTIKCLCGKKFTKSVTLTIEEAD